jgi:hypothetical protein
MVLSVLNVAVVLKSGGDFSFRHVHWLEGQIARHLTVPHRFVVFSDIPAFFESTQFIRHVPLTHGWRGWWSKIELFRPGLFDGPVLYFDLDALIVGNIDELATAAGFVMLEGFWPHRKGLPNSSVMYWDVDLSEIYERFLIDPPKFFDVYRTKKKWGDQDVIADLSPVRPTFWQDGFPGRFCSYKLTIKNDQIPSGASVVVFHGTPRPWETLLGKGILMVDSTISPAVSGNSGHSIRI